MRAFLSKTPAARREWFYRTLDKCKQLRPTRQDTFILAVSILVPGGGLIYVTHKLKNPTKKEQH